MEVAVDPAAPWLANMVFGLLVTALVTWGSVLVATRGQRKQATAARRDVAAVLEQVENDHSVGLRDDFDAKIAGLATQISLVADTIQRLADAQQDVIKDMREVRKDIGGLRADARADRQQTAELRRRVDQVAGAIQRWHRRARPSSTPTLNAPD